MAMKWEGQHRKTGMGENAKTCSQVHCCSLCLCSCLSVDSQKRVIFGDATTSDPDIFNWGKGKAALNVIHVDSCASTETAHITSACQEVSSSHGDHLKIFEQCLWTFFSISIITGGLNIITGHMFQCVFIQLIEWPDEKIVKLSLNAPSCSVDKSSNKSKLVSRWDPAPKSLHTLSNLRPNFV